MPIDDFLLTEAVRGSYRISRVGHWPSKAVGTTGKTRSHVDVCNEVWINLPLLHMPLLRKQRLLKEISNA